MRTLIFSIVFSFISMFAFAGLDPNITVTVDGKTYTCSESGTPNPSPTDCSEATALFKKKMDTCFQNYNFSDKLQVCMSKEWPKFKSANSKPCIYFASEACFNICIDKYLFSDKQTYCNGLCNLD